MNRLLVLGVIWAAAATGAIAAESQFTQMLNPEDAAAAGLDKLTPAERAKLDQLVEKYKRGALEDARRQIREAKAAQAAAEKAREQAVKEAAAAKKESSGLISKLKVAITPGTKIEYKPVETRIVGNIRGWDSHTVFYLENGQYWRVAEQDPYYIGKPLVNPKVVIRHVGAFGGFKMNIEGVGDVRVRLLEEVR